MGLTGNVPSGRLTGDERSFLLGFFRVKPLRRREVISVAWNPLQLGCYKLNIDASVLGGKAGGDSLIRDHVGRVICAFYKELEEM